ncbi:nuclear transport factor 2 family protein [Actinokineospora sp. NBRC 105648]|uniref:nuclear transport factor 2 family protein n=1 Tax=Actinokineospora sp. NBRC 105648 TaxID=3032206 RepID=UPI0024A4D1BC|nr:nuclear transport factor 2 family protein [Actinokineospora sp. NBRC 105648]GLZ42007.1 hypothetical protein Acsp05_56310 [Actinokineospora sp. NBRC 105648]
MTAADMILITDLIARVAQLADEGDIDDYLDLFTADAVWEMTGDLAVPAQTRTGRLEIAEGVRQRRAGGVQGPGSATRHIVSGTSVVPDGDHATAMSYWRFYTSTTSTPHLVGMGTYQDQLRRTDTTWRMSHRRITIG